MKNLSIVLLCFSIVHTYRIHAQLENEWFYMPNKRDSVEMQIVPNHFTLISDSLSHNDYLEHSDSIIQFNNETYLVYNYNLNSPINQHDKLISAYSISNGTGKIFFYTDEIKFAPDDFGVLTGNLDVLTDSIAVLGDTNSYYIKYNIIGSNPFSFTRSLINQGLFGYVGIKCLNDPIELAHVPTDPYFTKQWYLKDFGHPSIDGNIGSQGSDIRALDAWVHTKGNSNVVIAIIDGGFDIQHPDFDQTKWLDDIPSDNNNNKSITSLAWMSQDPQNANSAQYVAAEKNSGHGTQVAGIIAAQHNDKGIAGIAPDCSILPIRITTMHRFPVPASAYTGSPNDPITWYLNPDYNEDQIGEAIKYAVDNGADIISMSLLSGNPSNMTAYELDNALAAGIIFVSASGNFNTSFLDPNDPVGSDVGGPWLFPVSVMDADIDGALVVGQVSRYQDRMAYTSNSKNNNLDLVSYGSSDFCRYINHNSFLSEIMTTTIIHQYNGANQANPPQPWTGCYASAPGSSFIPAPTFNDYAVDVANNLFPPTHPYSFDQDYQKYTNRMSGTSYMAPQVAATAALMLSLEPNLPSGLVEDIILSTARRNLNFPYIFTYNQEGRDYSENIGCGILNAGGAVHKVIQILSKTQSDLYVRDAGRDLGLPNYGFNWYLDRSPDIRIRRGTTDGKESQQIDLNPSSTPIHTVFVDVHNLAGVSSTGNEVVELYWSIGATSSSWPSHWDGSSPLVGNFIGSSPIPQVSAYSTQTVSVPFIVPSGITSATICIMARIINDNDQIVIHPNKLELDIYKNNNIALRNVSTFMGTAKNGTDFDYYEVGNTTMPSGGGVLVRNIESTINNYSIDVQARNEFVEFGNIYLLFYGNTPEELLQQIEQSQDFERVSETANKFLLKNRAWRSEPFPFNALTEFTIYVG